MDTLIVTYIILHDENFTIVEIFIDNLGMGLTTLGIGLGLV